WCIRTVLLSQLANSRRIAWTSLPGRGQGSRVMRVEPARHPGGPPRVDARGARCAGAKGCEGWRRGLTAMSALRVGGASIGLPQAQGLYDPALDKDSCGVGFIADIKGRRSHKIIDDALAILCNLEHRGAVGADPRAGDGAGILVQIPHKFFVKVADKLGFKLPKPGEYAVGQLFMPRDPDWRQVNRDIYAQMIKRAGMTLLGWRDVPTDNSTLGESVKPTEPVHQQ